MGLSIKFLLDKKKTQLEVAVFDTVYAKLYSSPLMPTNLQDLCPDKAGMLSHPIRFTGRVCARLLPLLPWREELLMLSSWCGQAN